MSTLTISTADGTITDTQIGSGGLLNSDDGGIGVNSVSIGSEETVEIPTGARPLFAVSGIPIYSSSGVPIFESIIKAAKESDNLDGYQITGEAHIIISWSGSGYSDLDCCAYWSDNAAYKIGWSYGKGSMSNSNYRAWWTADNTTAGPETISLITTPTLRCPAESSPYQFKIHLNFYGSGSGTATANVKIIFGETSLNTNITPSTNFEKEATTDDPYVTITFASNGMPTDIS